MRETVVLFVWLYSAFCVIKYSSSKSPFRSPSRPPSKGGDQRMRELLVPWGRPKDAGAFGSMGETKGCGSFFFHGGSQRMRELFFPWGKPEDAGAFFSKGKASGCFAFFARKGRIQSLSPCRREVWREVFQIPTNLLDLRLFCNIR